MEVWRAPSSLITDAIVGTSPPTALGSEPARFLEPTIFAWAPDKPGMVSLSNTAGTEEKEEERWEEHSKEDRQYLLD